MDSSHIIGLFAALLVTVANVPQAYIIIRTKSAEHIAPTTYLILLAGTICWVVYGVLKMDWPIIITNSVTVLTSTIILVLNFSSKQTISKIHRKVLPKKIQEEEKKKDFKSKK